MVIVCGGLMGMFVDVVGGMCVCIVLSVGCEDFGVVDVLVGICDVLLFGLIVFV